MVLLDVASGDEVGQGVLEGGTELLHGSEGRFEEDGADVVPVERPNMVRCGLRVILTSRIGPWALRR